MDIKANILAKKEKLVDKYHEMDKGQRQLFLILFALIIGFGMLRWYSVVFGDVAQRKKLAAQTRSVVTETSEVALPNANALRELPKSGKNTGLDDLKLMVDELKSLAINQQKQIEQMMQRGSKSEAVPPVTLGTNLPDTSGKAGTTQAQAPDLDFSHLKPADGATSEQAPPPPKAEFVTLGADRKKLNAANKAKPNLVIPRGSGIEAVLMTGVDAFVDTTSSRTKPNVTGKGSSTNLFTPFVAKVKGEAIMPNNWRNSSLVDCFVTGSAIGNLSSERAYLKGEGITCVAESGEIFEGAMNSVVFGEDGKPGIAGTVVSKQGSVLAKQFMAGAVGGLAQMFAPTPIIGLNSNVSGNGQQQYQWPNPTMAAQSSLAGGLQQAGQQLAQFYLDFAKQMMPVIEITGGHRVTFSLQETLSISKSIAKE